MEFCDTLIELRIRLESLCDGFSSADLCKNRVLTSRVKVCFLLSNKDMTQGELISALCIAKSNMTNLLKSMQKENLIESYVDSTQKCTYFRILPTGFNEICAYKKSLEDECKDLKNIEDLKHSADNFLENLKRTDSLK